MMAPRWFSGTGLRAVGTIRCFRQLWVVLF